MPKTLIGFTDNEWSMIREALKFHMEYYFDDDRGGVVKTYALRLGELVDQVDRHITTKENNDA